MMPWSAQKHQSLNIWCNNLFTERQVEEEEMLVRGVGDHRVDLFEPAENGSFGASREALTGAAIAFGTPSVDALLSVGGDLRWVHINSAGYTPYDRDDLREFARQRNVRFTNSSAVYDEPCAQHILAMMLSFARGLPAALGEQRGNRGWLLQELRPAIRLLEGQKILILGFGSIGRRLAELLSPFRLEVVGVKRKPERNEFATVVDQAEADEHLVDADFVINILPANESTENFLDARRLSGLKHGAFVCNIGRGTTLDQNALIKELNSGMIAGAYLDVTDPEPLPPDHPLWSAPNCFITPHVGGGHAAEKSRQVRHFLDNLRRFEKGEDLINRIF